MKFKKPLSLLLAAVLLCAFAVPLLETPALAADKEIHEVATVGVYKWITITAENGGEDVVVTNVVQTGGKLPPGMSLGKNQDVSCLVGTPTTPGTYILTGETHYEDDAASWKYTWSVRLFVDVAGYTDANADNSAHNGADNGFQRPARRPHRRTPRRRRILRRRLPERRSLRSSRRRRPWRSAAAQRLWQTPPAGRGARGAF